MPYISGESGGGGGVTPVFAQVHRAAQINNWNGATLPFDVVDTDDDSVWDALNHAFAPDVAGWYQLAAFGTGNTTASFASSSGTGGPLLQIIVNGAGFNIVTTVSQHTGVVDGVWHYPPLIGQTHLDVGDSVEVDGTGGAGMTIPAGFSFSLLLVSPD